MRRIHFMLCALCLIGLAVVGCKKEEGKSAVDQAGQLAEDAAAAARDTAVTATEKVGDAASAAVEQGQKLLDQAMDYIKENKLELAEKAINQLDSMKASLPASLQDGLEKAKSALATAKATLGSGEGQPR